MPRINRKGELWSHLTSVQAIRDATGTFGSTTLTAAAAAGAGTLTVAGIANFAVGQTIAVGQGEQREIVKIHASTAPTGTTITLDPAYPLQYSQAIGDPVIQQALTDLGHVESGTVVVTHGGDLADVNSETQRLLLAVNTGFYDLQVEWALLGYNLENIATALGMLETRALGAGTPADPQTLTIDMEKVREQDNVAFRFTGVRKDGQNVRLTIMACELDPTVFALVLARSTKTTLPFRALVTAGVLYEINS